MTVKRFVAPDMRRALDLVRQEMGPDAIILSSQRTREGVEIITSSEVETVSRGGEERKEFGRRFDEELDQPLASDTAWHTRQEVAEATRRYTPTAVSEEAQRRERLARELEQARERMLTSKRDPRPAVPASTATETVRWREPAKPQAAVARPSAATRQSTPTGMSPRQEPVPARPQAPRSAAQEHYERSASYEERAAHYANAAQRSMAQPATHAAYPQQVPYPQQSPSHFQASAQGYGVPQAAPQYSAPQGHMSQGHMSQGHMPQTQPQMMPQAHSSMTQIHASMAQTHASMAHAPMNQMHSAQPVYSAPTQTHSEPYALEERRPVDRQMAGLQEQVKRLVTEKEQRDQPEDKRLAALQSELADMRLLLEQQMLRMREMGGPAVPANTSPSQEVLQTHLESLGLPSSLVKKLALAAKPGKRLNEAWKEALGQLTQHIATDTSDRIQKGGIFAFVGPTGVGKTTTIAKLAARYVLEHGLGKVALITTDTFRVGAHDQLRSLGRILNVPVRVVDQERSLPSVVASLKDYPLILIDTAGFRQGDPMLKEQEAMLDTCPGLERILVLACNTQLQTLKASTHAYSGGKVRGCILTKLDESGSLGEALGVVVQHRLPVLYYADGQAIPNDIEVASASKLVAKAVNIAKAQKEKTAATV